MVNGRRRDRAPFCVAGAALGAPDAAFAWQVQHLESLGAGCGQRSPRDRAPFCVAGAALGAPDAAFAWHGNGTARKKLGRGES